MEPIIITVSGMTCNHCKATIEKAVTALQGAEKVTVDLDKGRVEVVGSVSEAHVIEAIEDTGFEIVS